MTKHKDIQNPDDYTQEDYQAFEIKLFSPLTPAAELQSICMTLAHLPTKAAQDLLGKFQESARASEVPWLDIAKEEGEFHYHSPQNKQEERDYLALKVMQEIEDELIELQIKHDDFRLDLEKMEIKHEAIRELVKNGELEAEAELGLHEAKHFPESKMQQLSKEISVKEKVFAQIKKSIQTERYKDIDTMTMRHVHFG
jgi:hypothetical protein